jgi:hypothetical protein
VKFAGWLFIVMGVVASLALVEGFLEGDRPYGGVVLAAVALLIGLRFLTWAKGPLRTPDASEKTIELPLSPSAALMIGARPWKYVRQMAIFVVVVVALVFVVGTVVERSKSARYQRDPLSPVAGTRDPLEPWVPVIGAGATAGSLVLLILLVWVFVSWLPARRDLREAKYLRTSGPITVVGGMRQTPTLRLAGREMFVSYNIADEIARRSMKWAVVDYSKHTHIILGVWDEKGKVVFLAEGYSAEPPAVGSQS